MHHIHTIVTDKMPTQLKRRLGDQAEGCENQDSGEVQIQIVNIDGINYLSNNCNLIFSVIFKKYLSCIIIKLDRHQDLSFKKSKYRKNQKDIKLVRRMRYHQVQKLPVICV